VPSPRKREREQSQAYFCIPPSLKT
jgi:hypothetical protein